MLSILPPIRRQRLLVRDNFLLILSGTVDSEEIDVTVHARGCDEKRNMRIPDETVTRVGRCRHPRH